MLFDKIQYLSKQKGISISQLERMSNLSRGAISKWKTSNPSYLNLKSVADNLGVSVAYLADDNRISCDISNKPD